MSILLPLPGKLRTIDDAGQCLFRREDDRMVCTFISASRSFVSGLTFIAPRKNAAKKSASSSFFKSDVLA